jgi:hypothetical protein
MSDEIRNNAKIIYDTEDYLIVAPLNMEGMCYYDKENGWCDNSRYGIEELNKVLDGGVIYVFINKKYPSIKEVFGRNKNNEIFDESSSVKLSDAQKELSVNINVPEEVVRQLLGSQIFFTLRKYLRGKVDKNYLFNSDQLIYDVRTYSDNTETLILEFENDVDFYETINLDEDDMTFLDYVNSSSGWEFTSFDNLWDDTHQGYGIFNYFNVENNKKLEKIKNYLNPSLELDSDKDLKILFGYLDDSFSRQTNNMISELSYQINNSSNENAQIETAKEIDGVLDAMGFSSIRKWDKLEIEISSLLLLYSKVGQNDLSIRELISMYLKKSELTKYIGNWYENSYEFESTAHVNWDRLYREFDDELDKIIEKMEDDVNSEKLTKFRELYSYIEKNFGKEKYIVLPKNKNINFSIEKYYPEEAKVELVIRGLKGTIRHKFDKENLIKFLYQPELFDLFDK